MAKDQGLKQQAFIVSLFQRPEVQDQGVARFFLKGCERGNCARPLSQPLAAPWLVAA